MRPAQTDCQNQQNCSHKSHSDSLLLWSAEQLQIVNILCRPLQHSESMSQKYIKIVPMSRHKSKLYRFISTYFLIEIGCGDLWNFKKDGRLDFTFCKIWSTSFDVQLIKLQWCWQANTISCSSFRTLSKCWINQVLRRKFSHVCHLENNKPVVIHDITLKSFLAKPYEQWGRVEGSLGFSKSNWKKCISAGLLAVLPFTWKDGLWSQQVGVYTSHGYLIS